MGQPRPKMSVLPEQVTPVTPLRLVEKPSLSTTLWKIEWPKYFREPIGEGISVHKTTLKEVGEFASKNRELVYGDSPESIPFLVVDTSEEGTKARALFYEETADFFIFKQGTKPIGFFVGNVLDWQTYYWRSVAILPEYQGQKVYQTFLSQLLECLKASSVKRIEADISPANFGSIHVLVKLRFHITGFHASERWGNLVHFTKFLEETHNTIFLKQFCCSVDKKKVFPTKR